MFEVVTDRLWPVLVDHVDLYGKEIDEINGMMREDLLEQYSSIPTLHRSNFTQTGTWHSPNIFREQPDKRDIYDPFFDIIESVVRHVYRTQRIGGDPILTNLWSIISPPGGGNMPHRHPFASMSGVYYLQAPKDCGKIVFVDPRHGADSVPFFYNSKMTEEERDAVRFHQPYEPRVGRLIIFPTYLMHYVEPNANTGSGVDSLRISIAFNTKQKPPDMD